MREVLDDEARNKRSGYCAGLARRCGGAGESAPKMLAVLSSQETSSWPVCAFPGT